MLGNLSNDSFKGNQKREALLQTTHMSGKKGRVSYVMTFSKQRYPTKTFSSSLQVRQDEGSIPRHSYVSIQER